MTIHRRHGRLAIAPEFVAGRILDVRGHRVLLDADLALLYGVSTKALKQGVRRNLDRFPADFAFELTSKEVTNLRSQFVTSSWGGQRYTPLAFTEQGVAMLSSVLRSDRAVQVNVAIMRAFVQVRSLLSSHSELMRKIDALEKKVGKHDEQIAAVFEAIRQLMQPVKDADRDRIGFDTEHP